MLKQQQQTVTGRVGKFVDSFIQSELQETLNTVDPASVYKMKNKTNNDNNKEILMLVHKSKS